MRHTDHVFQESTERAEARTKIVMALTACMMVAEIAAGTAFNSMALLADGWHMGTHMSAFLIAVVAYSLARKNRDNKRFSFGTGKIGVLGGFTSSLLLLAVAAVMIRESALRLLHPAAIRYGEALFVAVLGLTVNLVSAFILKDSHSHSHSHSHGTEPSHGHDKNLKAAYIHVIADAFTSVTAIAALLAGLFFGIGWVDALMGFLGSGVIVAWAVGMIKDTVGILVDYTPKDCDLELELKKAIEGDGTARINDLHVWQVAAGKYAAIISIEAEHPKRAADYYALANVHEELVHVSIQVCD
jgi:cation diffusion facilitator family transporter